MSMRICLHRGNSQGLEVIRSRAILQVSCRCFSFFEKNYSVFHSIVRMPEILRQLVFFVALRLEWQRIDIRGEQYGMG